MNSKLLATRFNLDESSTFWKENQPLSRKEGFCESTIVRANSQLWKKPCASKVMWSWEIMIEFMCKLIKHEYNSTNNTSTNALVYITFIKCSYFPPVYSQFLWAWNISMYRYVLTSSASMSECFQKRFLQT